MKNIINNKYSRYTFLVIFGILLGWIFFHSPGPKQVKTPDVTNQVKTEIWTCSMHPQVRMTGPGKCPICGMDLIPLNTMTSQMDSNSIHLTPEALQLANVITSKVNRQNPVKDISLYGKVEIDERRLQNQVAYFPGRIEKLMINFTGEKVTRGETLAVIYSPELITAQQELIEAAKTKDTQPEIYEASREKLLQWHLTGEQITGIETSGKVQNNFEVKSTTSGVVISRNVNNGDYVGQGSSLFEVADLSSVWVLFDAYESDLSFIKTGDKIVFTVQALPGKKFAGRVAFIDAVIDPVTRVAKLRVEAQNSNYGLKPEMFATGIIHASLKDYEGSLVIPKTAVLWTGKRSIVYVKDNKNDEPSFRLREIELGPMLGDSYVVVGGLNGDEEIVTSGAFSVDAAAQLAGKPSMMNQMDMEEKIKD